MKRKNRVAASILAVAIVATFPGCSKSTTDGHDATATQSASVALSPSASASADDAASPAQSPLPTPGVRFDDISGVNGSREIIGFAKLGVIDPLSGNFEPGSPVRRRDFIRWLVKANNVLWADSPSKIVKLADVTETSSFPDVKTGDPDFPYIQGMQNAGYSVGFPDRSFGPDQSLTREQMFAIKNVFDRGTVDPGLVKGIDFARNTAMAPWKDKDDISKTYVPGIATGEAGGQTSFSLVYGSASLFDRN
jgi:hypothetical protein